MRHLLLVTAVLMLLSGCSADDQGEPWQIEADSGPDAGADVESPDGVDTAEDTGPTGLDFVGEARILATGLERIAVVARDRNSPLCIFIVLVSPGNVGTNEDVEFNGDWAIESLRALGEGCPGAEWPSREGLAPDTATGRIELYQSMGADRYTSVVVDLELTFPENEQDVPQWLVLDFPHLEL